MRETRFKDTEIGLIPENWEVKKLGDVAEIARGGSPRPIESFLTSSCDGVNWIKIGDVGVKSKYIEHTEERIIKSGAIRSRVVHSGDFLLSNSMSFGRPYILKIDGCIHDGWLVIQDYQDFFNVDYLYYVLCSENVLSQYKTMAAGSSVLNLNKEIVKKVLVPFPSNKKEQSVVANMLSDVDGLLREFGELIAKKKAIKMGMMQELLTVEAMPGKEGAFRPKRRLEGFEGDWVEKRLGELAQITMGQSPSSSCYNVSCEGLPLIQGNADIKDRKTIIRVYTSQSTKVCEKGDVIMSVRAPVGAVGIASFDSCIGRGVCSFKSKNGFLFHYLVFFEDKWSEFSKGSTFDSINSADLYDIKFVFPLDEAEQTAIAELLSDMDAEIGALEAKRAKYEQVKNGMMQELLTGKIRLV